MTAVAAHNAKFTDAILPDAVGLLRGHVSPGGFVLDPFAGTGKGVEYLRAAGFEAFGIELEPEWAAMSRWVYEGDALDLPYQDAQFDAVFTSPTYGNRMADRDMRASVAGTYAKALGRHATQGSSCHMQWGAAYRTFHRAAWAEAKRVLVPHGYFLLNIKDHVRGKAPQGVPEWHYAALQQLGFTKIATELVPVNSLRFGANHEARADHEELTLFRAA